MRISWPLLLVSLLASATSCASRPAPPAATPPPPTEPAAAASAAVPPAASPAEPGTSRPGVAAPHLEILPATWSSEQVAQYMKSQVAPALGVRCDHCHVEGDFASDANPKKAVARGMMRMVADLNSTRFAGQERITCMTCHNGQVKPAPR